MFENIANHLKLLAIAAIAQAEMWAAKQLEELGQKISGTDKRAEAKNWVLLEYKKFEAGIVILNATEIDDAIVDKAAGDAIDWAFERAGDAVNAARKLLPLATTTAPELPVGGLE
jgi:hypothetical protein